jgi:transcriptional regulator with PAS, ATPase and Fis domain
VALNCAAFPETLLEAELFGHERGAFTGAVRRRDGRFKAADGGTIFLDEVAELPLASQAKLLRVLEHGSFEPLGTNQTVTVDVRVVSATHRRLRDMLASGRFREDLFYRLKLLEVEVPPLRARTEDIPSLVQHFLRLHRGTGPSPALSAEAGEVLQAYSYPGNVRELEHAVRHAIALARGEREIELAHLPEDVLREVEASGAAGRPAILPLAAAIREFERGHLLRALAAADGKKLRAAKLLGISRKSLWEKLHRHGIAEPPASAQDDVLEAGEGVEGFLPVREDSPLPRSRR